MTDRELSPAESVAPPEPDATATASEGVPVAETDEGPDWLDPSNLPSSGDEFLEWVGAHVPRWTRLASQLNFEAFGAWEFEQVVHEAEALMKDMESGFASMYSPTCKALEEEYQHADLAKLYRDGLAAIEQINAALHHALDERVRSMVDPWLEDWEREEIEGLLEAHAWGTPTPGPGRPSGFRIDAMPPGALGIGFEGVGPENSDGSELGIVYQVQRRIASGPFEYLTSCDSPAFRDTSLPVGTRVVVYRVTAHRGRRMGEPAYARVEFFPQANGATLVENPNLAE
jgi:hypothetical protein